MSADKRDLEPGGLGRRLIFPRLPGWGRFHAQVRVRLQDWFGPQKPGLHDDDFFLPDFCAMPAVLAVVVLSELFAIIVTLAPLGPSGNFWIDLALASLFMQWVAVTGAASLCMLAPYLRPMSTRAAALVAWLLLVVLVGFFSQLTVRIAVEAVIELPQAFVLRNMAIGAIVSAILLRYLYLQHQWQQRLRAEANARVQALQARIRPHFLFNSMNTIASLIRSRPETAEAAVEDLADLFRASLAEEKRLIPLADELELCRRYLHMEQLRLGDRLRVSWELDALPTDTLVPPLTLQPLLENAVYHGIEPLPEGGTIEIRGRMGADSIIIQVENPRPLDPRGSGTGGHRMAVENIRERIALHFGRAAGLETMAADGRYSLALTLPLRRKSQKDAGGIS